MWCATFLFSRMQNAAQLIDDLGLLAAGRFSAIKRIRARHQAKSLVL
jgi:hypothetical protein